MKEFAKNMDEKVVAMARAERERFNMIKYAMVRAFAVPAEQLKPDTDPTAERRAKLHQKTLVPKLVAERSPTR